MLCNTHLFVPFPPSRPSEPNDIYRVEFANPSPVLPHRPADHVVVPVPPEDVTKIALRLRHLIEQCVPCELEESAVTQAHSRVITTKVIKAAKEAGGEQSSPCVVFCLLVCVRWFKRQATLELWDADLHNVRATACEVIAKAMLVLTPNSRFTERELKLGENLVSRTKRTRTISSIIFFSTASPCW